MIVLSGVTRGRIRAGEMICLGRWGLWKEEIRGLLWLIIPNWSSGVDVEDRITYLGSWCLVMESSRHLFFSSKAILLPNFLILLLSYFYFLILTSQYWGRSNPKAQPRDLRIWMVREHGGGPGLVRQLNLDDPNTRTYLDTWTSQSLEL